MFVRKALGIMVLSTQAVIAVDYNMQSQKAGLGPGELSMKDYMALVQKRYDPKPASQVAEALQESVLWQRVTELGGQEGAGLSGGEDLAEAAGQAPQEAPATVCIRRGTALDCQ
ncbi:hypothetical protein [Phaeobacter sp. 11ANDIMAR09]|uniref:hypothetical protein n=1 Tax=Phaeobacter sp. 11ANDIMAR09 TaxID=1225647 RepID=UPI0006C8D7E7|nr:hypothetical protein [Phaeobacter sp. 11ANDIMAR09]KPD11000.1 hypothetical protein AN476_17960 [Phaeobacter sp. 11ANDIMAR09]